MTESTHQNLMRAYELRSLHREREALAVLDRVLAAEPMHSRALNLRSMCLSSLGEHDEAILAARVSATADPQSGHPFWTLSLALAAAGRSREAVEAAATAVRLEPDDWTNHERLARCLLLENNPAAALAPAEHARELAPERATVHIACGTIYEALGRKDEARAAYERALALEPQNSNAHFYIARLDKGARKWEQALHGFSRAARLNPKSWVARRQIETLILKRLSVPMVFAFCGAGGACTGAVPGGDVWAYALFGAVELGIVGGVTFLTIRRLYRAAGPFLWHVLRTDGQARVIEVLTLIYILWIAAMTETPLDRLGGYPYKVAGVIGLRVLAEVVSGRIERRRGGIATPRRKREHKPRTRKLEDGAES